MSAIAPVIATTLWDMLAQRAAQTPDRVMLIDEHGRQETFGTVARQAVRLAAGLLRLDVEPGSVVSWQLSTRIETIVLSFALSRLGVVQNPIIPIYRRREVTAMVRQCKSDWLITPGVLRGFDHAAMAEEIRTHVAGTVRTLVLDGALPDGDPALLPPVPASGEDVRWIYTTSGTTSLPKGVCHSDAGLIAGGLALADAVSATPADRSTIFFPVAHIGAADMLVLGLREGAALVLLEVFDPTAAVALIREHGVTIAGGGPAHYAMFMREQQARPERRLAPPLRLVAGGGAPLATREYGEITTELGVPVLHSYGMTESAMIASGRSTDAPDLLARTVGPAVRGCEIEVRSEDGARLEAGQDGQVWIRGATVFQHYLVDGRRHRPHDDDGWFATGDTGHLRPDGRLVLVGREKDLIIRKGESISPAEIEDVLTAHPGITEVAVIGLPDEYRGERICAVVRLRDGTVPLTIEDLGEHCRNLGLSPNKVPEQIEVVEALPRTPTMKVRKADLRTHFGTAAASSGAVAP